jgi:hypothetical protein
LRPAIASRGRAPGARARERVSSLPSKARVVGDVSSPPSFLRPIRRPKRALHDVVCSQRRSASETRREKGGGRRGEGGARAGGRFSGILARSPRCLSDPPPRGTTASPPRRRSRSPISPSSPRRGTACPPRRRRWAPPRARGSATALAPKRTSTTARGAGDVWTGRAKPGRASRT